MSILRDIKKLLFGAESVGKSAARKTKHSFEELTDDFKSKTEKVGKDLENKTGGIRDAILHQAEGTIDMVSKNEKLQNAAEKTERFSEKILDKGEEAFQKGSEQIEKLGQTILGENNENVEKLKDFTEDVGKKVLETTDKAKQKANEHIDQFNKKVDQTLEKARKEEEAEKAKGPQKDLQTILDENEGSLLDDKDDFFSKASKYASGNYGQEGKISIDKNKEKPKKDNKRAAGFEDRDGDGNEIIDDAIIDED